MLSEVELYNEFRKAITEKNIKQIKKLIELGLSIDKFTLKKRSLVEGIHGPNDHKEEATIYCNKIYDDLVKLGFNVK